MGEARGGREASMSAETKYRLENVGDWGVPRAAAGGEYGTDELPMADGTKVFFRYWLAPEPQAPVLVYLHGLGAHTGWFLDFGNELNARGLTVFMDDHRGFGRSEGPRGHVRDASVYPRDVAAFVEEVRRRRPGAPIFLMGHSMGGIFAVHTAVTDAASGRNALRGLILINPWIKDIVKVRLSMVVPGIVAGMFGSAKALLLPPSADNMTLDAEAQRLLSADTYWVRNQSKAFLYQVSRMRLAMPNLAARLRLPALVIQTEGDLTLSQPATRAFFDRLGSEDKTYKTYPRLPHDFEFDHDRSALDADLADWIMRHAA